LIVTTSALEIKGIGCTRIFIPFPYDFADLLNSQIATINMKSFKSSLKRNKNRLMRVRGTDAGDLANRDLQQEEDSGDDIQFQKRLRGLSNTQYADTDDGVIHDRFDDDGDIGDLVDGNDILENNGIEVFGDADNLVSLFGFQCLV